MRVTGILFVVLVLAVAANAQSQTTSKVCEPNRTAPPAAPFSWAPDTAVRVFMTRGMFTSEQSAALKAAMDFWSQTAVATGAGVTFQLAGETDGIINCSNCLIVSRQNIREHYRNQAAYRNFLAYFLPIDQRKNGLLKKGLIIFDDRTTKPEVLQTFMAHELAHSMGLWDCFSCHKKATLMRKFPAVNKVDRVLGPSNCDLEVVRSVYQSRRELAGR